MWKLKKVFEFIANFDAYGHPVTLTLNKKATH
jgi:hypothetical protein